MRNLFTLGMRCILSLALLAATQSAYALTTSTVLGADFVNGQSSYNQTFADGTVATFTGSRSFEKKTQAGMTGVGISGGRTAGEIDIDEKLTGTFSKAVIVNTITVGLLFDGPEYSDVKEVAKFLVSFSDGGADTYYLTALGESTASWTGAGGASSVLSLGSGAVDGGTGAWQLTDPFGSRAITSIVFSAATGEARHSCTSCTNQSDYTLVSMAVTPVPEAHTSAMMLTGLFMIGALALRRMKS
ncbi:MAG: hypothetical protein ACTS9Y_03515 [Methylophilus sp.]|uniref:hypothetical protein n=1 Tax=Methylophilus sp. TaxID=29541 RepID=UPI003FA0CFE6